MVAVLLDDNFASPEDFTLDISIENVSLLSRWVSPFNVTAISA